MRTKQGFITAAAVTAMVAGVPAVAEAHHVASGGAQCSLVGNVPTITASASFVSFAAANKPIAGQLSVDGVAVQTVTGFTFTGANGTWNSAQHAVAPGDHHVSGAFTWPNQGSQNGRFEADVSCPTPAVPSPAPPTTSTSTPDTPVTATPATPVAATVASPPAAQPVQGGGVLPARESGRCVPRKLGRYRITVTPKGALHGLVTFHLQGSGVSNVRWYVDTRRAGRSATRWEWVRQSGRAYSIYLWAQQRWGKHLWGRHTVEARFRVKDSCGRARAVHVQRLYFNHDPLPNDPIFAH